MAAKKFIRVWVRLPGVKVPVAGQGSKEANGRWWVMFDNGDCYSVPNEWVACA